MSNVTRIGLIRCEHCGRQFNPHAGARHIPWCANQQNEQRKHKLSVEKREALERYKWRISYRPSNQLHPQANQQRRLDNNRTPTNGLLNERAKKSSTNSSATMSSSASASSTASVASTLNEVHHSHQLRHQVVSSTRHQQTNQPTMRQNQVGQLKRSISSLTMTRQPGVLIGGAGDGQQTGKWRANGTRALPTTNGDYGNHLNLQQQQRMQLQQQRTKSVNDLYYMSEIVETLSKRMDEIYAQNQILLARISSSGNSNSDRIGTAAPEAGVTQSEDSCSDNGVNSLVRCHHCKSSCFESANYCHKCGCKVRATSPSSPRQRLC